MAMRHILRHSAAPTFFQRHLFFSSTRACAEVGGEDGSRSATVEFLENSCGLSSDTAAAAAKKIHLKTTANAKSVLALLTQRGFSQPQISKLVASLPRLLAASPEKTIKPKLDFFRALELSDAEVAEVFLARKQLFIRSVEKVMAPNVELLRSILKDESKVLYAIKKYPPFAADIPPVLLPNIQALKDYGAPESLILNMFITCPNALVRKQPFQPSLELIKRLGILPSSWVFRHAFKVLNCLSKSSWERKMSVFRSLGWTEEQVMHAFGKNPYCMTCSVEKIRKNSAFFLQKLNWGPATLYLLPRLLAFSLQKRIIPRYFVLKILTSKGLLKTGITASGFILSSEAFRRKYILKYQNEIPEVVDAMKESCQTDFCSSNH